MIGQGSPYSVKGEMALTWQPWPLIVPSNPSWIPSDPPWLMSNMSGFTTHRSYSNSSFIKRKILCLHVFGMTYINIMPHSTPFSIAPNGMPINSETICRGSRGSPRPHKYFFQCQCYFQNEDLNFVKAHYNIWARKPRCCPSWRCWNVDFNVLMFRDF